MIQGSPSRAYKVDIRGLLKMHVDVIQGLHWNVSYYSTNECNGILQALRLEVKEFCCSQLSTSPGLLMIPGKETNGANFSTDRAIEIFTLYNLCS